MKTNLNISYDFNKVISFVKTAYYIDINEASPTDTDFDAIKDTLLYSANELINNVFFQRYYKRTGTDTEIKNGLERFGKDLINHWKAIESVNHYNDLKPHYREWIMNFLNNLEKEFNLTDIDYF